MEYIVQDMIKKREDVLISEILEVIENQQAELCKLRNEIDSLSLMFTSEKEKSTEQAKTIKELKSRIAELQQGNIDRFNESVRFSATIEGLKQLNISDEYIEKLNIMLSSHRTVWGNKDRLHISKLAAVNSCIFNTNSGDIWIDDYVFAGPGVSVLAGSHDVRLTGLLRREYAEKDGCDIEIDEGVWLASNSTILGPAKIGKNSVIAAGAVVIPGTVIPQNTIYGGIPAKGIKKIDFREDAITDCLKKNEGIIYGDGWSEEREFNYEEHSYKGHFLERLVGEIYTDQKEMRIFYVTENYQKSELYYTVDGKEKTLPIGCSGELFFTFEGGTDFPNKMIIKKNSSKEKVFFLTKGF